MDTALQAMYADADARLTRQTVRAYGKAFTAWMTGRPALEFGEGTRPEQHARMSQHYRRSLASGIEADVDRQIREQMHRGTLPPQAQLLLSPGAPERQAASAGAQKNAQVQFLRGQYRVNMLLLSLVVDLERSRQNAVTRACLMGAGTLLGADVSGAGTLSDAGALPDGDALSEHG